MRLFVAGALALSIGLYVTYDQFVKGAATAEDQADKLAAVKKRFTEEFDELIKKFEKASTVAEKRGVQAEARELATLTAEKVRKIAEANPKSASAFDAAYFTLSRLVSIGASGPDVDKMLALVAENHLDNPKVKTIVLTAVRAGPSGEKFLLAVAEKSKDKAIRGISLYILGMNYAEQADEATSEAASKALVKKALGYLARALQEAPETKISDGETIATSAAIEIKSLKTLAIGSPVPIVLGTELRDQKKQKISDYKGKVVLLDIWATWCGPCVSMIPHEREMVKRLKGKPFELISVSVDQKQDRLKQFIEKEPMPWTHWWDDGDDNPLIKTLKVRAFPTLYLIDAKGVIRRKWVGVPQPLETLDKAVDELVKEASGAKG